MGSEIIQPNRKPMNPLTTHSFPNPRVFVSPLATAERRPERWRRGARRCAARRRLPVRPRPPLPVLPPGWKGTPHKIAEVSISFGGDNSARMPQISCWLLQTVFRAKHKGNSTDMDNRIEDKVRSMQGFFTT